MNKQLYAFDYHCPGMIYITQVYDCKDEKDAREKLRKRLGVKRLPNNIWIGNKRSQ